MAKQKVIETGQAYLDRILQHVPEAQRAAVAEALGNDGVKSVIGEGVLMKDEASRLAQEATAAKTKFEGLYENNKEWIAAKQDQITNLITENAQLKSGRAPAGGTSEEEHPVPPTAAAPKVELPADLVRQTDLAQLRQQASGYINGMVNLGMRHLHEWKEPLDLAALDAHCQAIGKLALQGGYESFMAERRAEKNTQAEKDREAQIRKDERDKILREQSAPPAPSADGALLSFDQGTLVGLNKDRKQEFGVDAAVRGTLQRRQTTKGA